MLNIGQRSRDRPLKVLIINKMAFIDETLLYDFQATEATNEKFDASYGMLDLAKDSTPSVDYVPPSVKEKLATISSSRLGNIPVLKDQTVTVSTTPGFSQIPINLGETANYYFTAYDVFSGFRFFPAAYENNQIDPQWYASQILRNVLKEMAVTIDGIVGTVMNSRKTQVLNYTDQVSQGEGTFEFDQALDVLKIDKPAQKDTMFTNLQTLMRANQLGGEYRLVVNPAGLSTSEVEAMKYAVNQEKQLLWSQAAMPRERRYESHQLSTTEVFDGYLCRDGSIGLYENFPWNFRAGTEIGGKKWKVSEMEMPYIKMRPNIFMNTEATEAESLVKVGTNSGLRDSNLTMTHFEEMAIWVRFYVAYRYNSDLTTRQNDIVKVRGLKGTLGGA